MTRGRVAMGIGALLGVLSVVGAAPALAQDAPRPRVLLFGVTDNEVDMRTYAREDLRPVPPPPDRLGERVRITVVDGDPLCLPGAGAWAGPPSATGSNRISGRR